MYLREALGRCRDLEEDVSNIYKELASQHVNHPEFVETWNKLACDERTRSHQLGALLAIHEALDDDGPFLVGLDKRSQECRQQIRSCYARLSAGITPTEAVELCVQLESGELGSLFIDMLDLARPALKRLTDKLYRQAARPSGHHDEVEKLRTVVKEKHKMDRRTGASVARDAAPTT